MPEHDLKPLRVLMVEDSADDELLLRRQLKNAGYNLLLQRVDSNESLISMMPPELWDVVVSDYKISPGFNGMDALHTVREFDKNIPFILMSGTVGEELAVEAMKHGASDYIMKDKSARLPQAIERELRQADERRTRILAEQQMNFFASHDVLTGLWNRREFDLSLARMLQEAKDKKNTHVLMYMDLDQFKVLNDTVGHAAGDALLSQISALMVGFVRERSDTVARLGGDEFGVLMANCEIDRALFVANAIREAIQQYRFEWDGQIFTIGISIGISLITEKNTSSGELLAEADSACFAAKAKGRNQVHVYKADDQETVENKHEMRWALAIPEAIRNGSFQLYYQPIQTITDDSRHHGEILLRMRDQQNNLIFPDSFIPAAERFDLMPSVDRWVVTNVLQWIKTNIDQLPAEQEFSINLSGKSFLDPQFMDFLLAILKEIDIDPKHICFELTESAAVGKFSDAIKFISTFRDRGYRFSLDDFGSGMCSLKYLRNLPVDYLKIDGSFVKEIVHDKISLSIVESVNSIAHAMGIRTVAEYVENEAIYDLLKKMGVDYCQGYFVDKPKPLDDLMLLYK
jgi:diguanylate cyclase (GGDEF)-like protein